MAITNITNVWQSVTLARDEIWIVQGGEVLVSTDPSADRLGAPILWGMSIPFQSGQTVYYRLQGSFAGTYIERI